MTAGGRWERISRREAITLSGIVLAALALRAWGIWNGEIINYDEGVYAYTAMGLTERSPQLYPAVLRHAPPLYYVLTALLHSLMGGEPHRIAMWISVLFGSATVGLVWLAGRLWFQPVAGLIAAMLLAMSEFHISMSRLAMTDSMFACFFLAALILVSEALETLSWRHAIAAGLLVGLAWNTKQHGSFAVMIAAFASALLAWNRWKRPYTTQLARRVAIMGAVAAVCYTPALLLVQYSSGNYGGLLQHYRRYLNSDIIGGILAHAEMQWRYEGPIASAAVLLALGLGIWTARKRLGVALLAVLLAAPVLLGLWATALLLALFWTPKLLRRPFVPGRLLLFGWMALWLLALPLYRPYARLALPLAIASYIAAGAALASAMRADRPKQWRAAAVLCLAGALGAAWLSMAGLYRVAYAGQPSPWHMEKGARALVSEIRDVARGATVLVFEEPVIAYYLQLSGVPHRPVWGVQLEHWESSAYVVMGDFGRTHPVHQKELARVWPRLSALRSLPDVSPYTGRQLRDVQIYSLAGSLEPDSTPSAGRRSGRLSR